MATKDSDGVEEAAMEGVAKSEELPERWSARAKTETVLRLLKGEDIGTVSREEEIGSGGGPDRTADLGIMSPSRPPEKDKD